jgi:ABC-type uncharacterized transport system substrate-binding protein
MSVGDYAMRTGSGQQGPRKDFSRSKAAVFIAQHLFLTLALCAMLLALCGSVSAQQPGKIFRIGYLDPSTASGGAARLELFRQEMNKLGWTDGKNVTFEYRFAEGKGDQRLAELAGELVRLKVDLIVTSGGPTPFAAKKATTTIPIVMLQSTNPVGEGLVASLARPGGNITGITGINPELNTKRLEILKDAIPGISRVGVLRTPGTEIAQNFQFKELPAAAQALKIKLEEIIAQRAGRDLESAFQSVKRKQVGAILTMAGNVLFTARKQIVELASKYRVPAIYPTKEYVEVGGLMSYGGDPTEQLQRAAVYVDKILKGAKPADLPVQQATKFEFIVNLKAAKQIGLTIPVRVLERANQVIK